MRNNDNFMLKVALGILVGKLHQVHPDIFPVWVCVMLLVGFWFEETYNLVYDFVDGKVTK